MSTLIGNIKAPYKNSNNEWEHATICRFYFRGDRQNNRGSSRVYALHPHAVELYSTPPEFTGGTPSVPRSLLLSTLSSDSGSDDSKVSYIQFPSHIDIEPPLTNNDSRWGLEFNKTHYLWQKLNYAFIAPTALNIYVVLPNHVAPITSKYVVNLRFILTDTAIRNNKSFCSTYKSNIPRYATGSEQNVFFEDIFSKIVELGEPNN